jgi:glutaredoxin
MPIRITLYSKAGCGLCEDAYEVVSEVRSALGSSVETALEVVDITTDSALMARYRHDIPVVLIDGRSAFQHHVDPEKLRRLLLDRPAPTRERQAAHGTEAA